MAGLLPADTLQLLQRLAGVECDVEATLAARVEAEGGAPLATLAKGLAAMPYPLLAAEAASVRVYCACLVRAGPDRVPRLLGCLRARVAQLASLASLDDLSNGDANILGVLGLATLTRCVIEQLVREPPRSVAEWDAVLSPPSKAEISATTVGAGLAYAADSLLECVARCSVEVNDARYYVLAEVICALVLLAAVRTSPMPGRPVFGWAFVRSPHASEASRRLLGHVVLREPGTAPALPSMLYRKIGSLATALFSAPSSLFAMVGIGNTPDSALAATSDPASAAMAAAAEAAAIAAAHVEAAGDAYRTGDDSSTALLSLPSADVLAERALALMLLVSQFDQFYPESEPEPEPEPELELGPRPDAEPGSSITNPFLNDLGGSSDLGDNLSYGSVYSRMGAWLADPRGTAWAYVLVTNPHLGGFRKSLLERTDVDVWLLPLLQQLYALSGPQSQRVPSHEKSTAGGAHTGAAGTGSASVTGGERHRIVGTELVLVILLELLSCESASSESDGGNSWCEAVHTVVLNSNDSSTGGGGRPSSRQIPSWFSAEQIKQQLTIGSMLVIVICRAIIRNLQLVVPSRSCVAHRHSANAYGTGENRKESGDGGGFARTHGQFVLRSALALLENIVPHLHSLHAIAADRLVRTYLGVLKRLTTRVTPRTETCSQGGQEELQQHQEDKQAAEGLLWAAVGLFDGLLVNDHAVRRNAELMYALLRSKDAIELQLAATRACITCCDRGTGEPVVAVQAVPVEAADAADAAATVTATATMTAGLGEEGSEAAQLRLLDNLHRAVQVFDDAATQATAAAAATAAANALGRSAIPPTLPEVDAIAPASGVRSTGAGINAAGTAEPSRAVSTVKDLMESCVAGTAAAWQGAFHHGLRLPAVGASATGTVAPWRFKQNSACAAAFLTPYVWQLARRLTREPTGSGGTSGGSGTGAVARLSKVARPAWASIPDHA